MGLVRLVNCIIISLLLEDSIVPMSRVRMLFVVLGEKT